MNQIKRRKLSSGLAAGVLVVLVGIGAGSCGLGGAKSGDGAETAAVTVGRGDLEDLVTAQGKLEPKELVDVGTQVSGQLRKLHVKVGDTVQSGALLAEIDPRVYEAQVQASEARLDSLKGQLREQQAQSVLAAQVLERNRELVAANAISKQALQESEAQAAVARARISSIQAQIAEVGSSLSGIRTNLGFTRILAPMSGTVTTLPAREGQTLNASQTAPTLLQIADLDTMTVRAQVAEADVTRLRAGMPAYFTTLGDPERRWPGVVRQILPSPETVNDVVLYPVLVDVRNEDKRLMTGMTTQVFFVLGEAQDVLSIPVEALGRRVAKQDGALGKAYQVRVASGSDPEERVIHTGLRTRSSVEVKAGLREGEQVLVRSGARAAQPERPRGGGGRGGRFGGGPVL